MFAYVVQSFDPLAAQPQDVPRRASTIAILSKVFFDKHDLWDRVIGVPHFPLSAVISVMVIGPTF